MLDATTPACTRRYWIARCRHATSGMHHVPSAMWLGGPPQTGKNRMFLRATGVGGKRSTTESERNSPNARVRTMRTSATTDVLRMRAWARAGGTRLGLRPNQPFGLGTPRPTGAGADAKPNSQCVASCVPVFAARGAVPLTVSRNVLCSRPTRCRPEAPADASQSDAHIVPRVCRRRPKSAVCAVLRACRGMALACRPKEERADDAGGRTSATAASYAASLFLCSASWRGVRLRRFGPIRCATRRRRSGQHSVTLGCS